MPGRGLLLAVLVVALAASACTASSPEGIAEAVGPGKPILNTAPPSTGDGQDIELTLRDGGELAILTWGSGSCPYVPVRMSRVDDHHVRIAMEARSKDGGPDCTADLGPSVATLRLRDDVKWKDAPVRIDIKGVGPDRAMSARLGFTNTVRNSIETPE